MSFSYDDNGIRTSKTVNGVTHTYYLNGSQIVSEKWSDKLLVYLYDVSGSPIGMLFRKDSYGPDVWDEYFFEKNLQGDIVSVYNSAGNEVVHYTYKDAWGNHSTGYTNISSNEGAQYNPFRYRGYYYDTDLEMYYLQSRYYDAKICRFISPDTTDILTATPMALTDKNLFAYCDNNPVMRVDGDGEFWNYVIGGVVGALVGGVAAALDGGNIADIIIGSLAGAASGLVAATGWGVIAQAGASAGIGAVADIANQTFDIFQNEGSIADYNIGQTVTETLFGFATSAAGSGLGLLASKLTGTSALADAAFNSYLDKTFSAGLRESIGRSSSALRRQAGKFLSQTVFWDNVTRGVSSVIGSIVVSGPTIPLKDLVLELTCP